MDCNTYNMGLAFAIFNSTPLHSHSHSHHMRRLLQKHHRTNVGQRIQHKMEAQKMASKKPLNEKRTETSKWAVEPKPIDACQSIYVLMSQRRMGAIMQWKSGGVFDSPFRLISILFSFPSDRVTYYRNAHYTYTWIGIQNRQSMAVIGQHWWKQGAFVNGFAIARANERRTRNYTCVNAVIK